MLDELGVKNFFLRLHRYRNRVRASAAKDANPCLNFPARIARSYGLGPVHKTGHCFAVHLQHRVARGESSSGGGAVGLHGGQSQPIAIHPHASTQPQAAQIFRREKFAERFVHAFDGNGKSETLSLPMDGHVDADEFAVEIHKRPAAVAGIDGGIGLQPVGDIERGVGLGRAPGFAAENAATHRAAEAKGIAQREHRFAQQQIVIAREGDGLELRA